MQELRYWRRMLHLAARKRRGSRLGWERYTYARRMVQECRYA